jgi:hypothetical protein
MGNIFPNKAAVISSTTPVLLVDASGNAVNFMPTSGTGTVVGPAGPVDDNSIVLFDGTSGALIKEGPAILIGNGNIEFQQSNATPFTDVDFNTDSFRVTNSSGIDIFQSNNSALNVYGYNSSLSQQYGRMVLQDSASDIYGYDSNTGFSIQRIHTDNQQFQTYGFDQTNQNQFNLINSNYNQVDLNGYDPSANVSITRQTISNTNYALNFYPASGVFFTSVELQSNQFEVFGRDPNNGFTFNFIQQDNSEFMVGGRNFTDGNTFSRLLLEDNTIQLSDYVQGVGSQAVINGNRTYMQMNADGWQFSGDVFPDASGSHNIGIQGAAIQPFSGVVAQSFITQSPNGTYWRLAVSDIGVITAVPY